MGNPTRSTRQDGPPGRIVRHRNSPAAAAASRRGWGRRGKHPMGGRRRCSAGRRGVGWPARFGRRAAGGRQWRREADGLRREAAPRAGRCRPRAPGCGRPGLL
eukprot:scaffold20379_cov79-Isochrysis_galbana.AAC.1